jgi:hydroxyacylglutathione hydrolase
MRVEIVPQLSDNYGYLLIEGGDAVIVDAAEVAPVLAAVKQHGVQLRGILSTHHHPDHVGANLELAAAIPGLHIVGNADDDRIPGCTNRVRPGDPVRIAGLVGEMLPVPCHTTGHVAYRFGSALFSGDTLFAAGCGRFFEGTAKEMYASLYEVIGKLPDDTRVYCGHEYTQKNLQFAATIEPSNGAIQKKLEEVTAQRAKGLPSVPTTLGEERTYNPFLRVASPEAIATVSRTLPEVDPGDPIAVLGALRALKDRY